MAPNWRTGTGRDAGRFKSSNHRFVRYIPEELEPGILYTSVDFATVAHACCCGCGEEVVTPLAPTEWR